MTTFGPGDRCRVVEHDDDDPRLPLDGGKVHEALVETVSETYVYAWVRFGSRHGRWVFWQGSGWGVTVANCDYRLMPATDKDAASAAGGGA